MSDYFSKQQDIILTHINETSEDKVSHLVGNRQMEDRDVHWHRGYIAAHQDLAVFIAKELPKKLNEA